MAQATSDIDVPVRHEDQAGAARADRDVLASARSLFRTRGYAQLPDVVTRAEADALSEEALRLWPSAGPPIDGWSRRAAMTRPGSGLTLRAAGPSLESLHMALARLARALSGQLLVPSWSGYYFYEGDDEVRLHVDTPLCDLTMVIVVMGTLGALHLHPELRGTAPAELQMLEADPEWDRASGEPVVHSRTGVTAFRGRLLPHPRPGRTLESLGAVAAFHYRRYY